MRYERSLDATDVGARVMVRRRLPDGRYGDVLGELITWAAEVAVRDRHGVTHVMPAGAAILQPVFFFSSRAPVMWSAWIWVSSV